MERLSLYTRCVVSQVLRSSPKDWRYSGSLDDAAVMGRESCCVFLSLGFSENRLPTPGHISYGFYMVSILFGLLYPENPMGLSSFSPVQTAFPALCVLVSWTRTWAEAIA